MQHFVESEYLMMSAELGVYEMVQSSLYVELLLAHNFDATVKKSGQ
jgi:hypothetical protein